ncbi:MAG: hypothetical protein D3922_00920, partial [Candidatus Electrothrix sp. AR1]|nr:hypothetical protein [Candidatus Electrothrix sp. AR1]
REQEFIAIINNGEGHSRNLVNMLNKFLDGVCINIDKNTHKGGFTFSQSLEENFNDQKVEWCIKRSNELIEIIVKLTNLLRYLEKEELATFFIPAKPSGQKIEFGGCSTGYIPISIPIYDQAIIDIMLQYIHQEIMPSPTLKKLEKNNFRTESEIYLKKQHIATWTAIFVSLTIGLLSFCISHQYSKQQKEQFSENIHQNEILVNKITTKLENLNPEIINYSNDIKEISTSLNNIYSSTETISKNIKSTNIKLPLSQKQSIKPINSDARNTTPKPMAR